MRQKASIASRILFLLFALIIPQMVRAQTNRHLDDLMDRINRRATDRNKALGEINIEAYLSGLSHCDQPGFVGRLFPHLLPFQSNTSKDQAFEAIVQASYHWPGGMKFSCKTLNATHTRRCRAMLKGFYQTLLPGLEIRENEDDTYGKFHVLPFTKEGMESYHYQFAELNDDEEKTFRKFGIKIDSSTCVISFSPLRDHHTMLTGNLVIDSTHFEILGFQAEGRIDMAKFETLLFFRQDTVLHQILPYFNRTQIHYNYAGTQGTNTFTALYKYKKMRTMDEVRMIHPRQYDLSSTYRDQEINEADFDTLRPILISPQIDSMLYTQQHTADTLLPNVPQIKPSVITISEHLIEGGRFGDEDNRLRLYGPLDPATFGYDGINGFSLNERLRWNVKFKNESSLNVSVKLGYAFRVQELRYQLHADWTFRPRKRQGISLSFDRSNTGISSKFITQINEALKEKKDTVDFYDLGIEYFQRHELRTEYHTELLTGLNLFAGVQYDYRHPIKHGKMGITPQRYNELVKQQFSDFAPFIRLEWTPYQYYYFEGPRKIYIDGHTPTFIVEATKAIPGIWGANSNYGRVEFDMSQNLSLGAKRHLAYRLGAGTFFNQEGEYFINYRYFSRNFYPTTWMDNQIGGTFHLLDEPWYSSSPSYLRAHMMYETPYGFIHNTLRSLSKFVIKERAYASLLGADGKQIYTELGYGFSNNYINIGVFVGFTDTDFYKVGAKIRFEITDHL